MQKGPTRPLMIWCILYLVMLAVLFLLSDFFVLQLLTAAVLLIGVGVLALLSNKEVPWLPSVMTSKALWVGAVIPIVAATAAVFLTMSDYRQLQPDHETTVQVCGVVERVYYATDRGTSFLLDLKSVDGKRNHGKLRVENSVGGMYANEGTLVSLQAVIGAEELNSEYLENIQYSFPDGIFAYAYLDGDITEHGTHLTFRFLCERIAAWCRLQLYQYLPEDAAELCISILLGEKSVLSPTIKRDFRRIGISHILAVSGMHFSILVNGLLFAMKKSGVPYRLRYLLLLVTVVIYMGITGFAPSVMRAGVMWILVCLAGMLREQTDSLTSLFTAAMVLCAISPQAVFDVGFLLSVSASLGLILLMEPLNKWLYAHHPLRRVRPMRALITLTATTLAATAFTAPIMLLVFGELSIIAPIANLLLHIPVVVLMYCVPIFLLLTLIDSVLPIGFLMRFLSGAIAGDTALITDLAGVMSKLPHVLVGVRYWFTTVLLAGFLIAVLVLLVRRKNLLFVYPIYGGFILSLVTAILVQMAFVRGDVILTYSVNGRNDNLTVVTDGQGMLIDVSDGSWKNMRLAWEQLSEQNVTELDVCVITHYHTRQSSALHSLFENTVVNTLLLPTPMTEEDAAICDSLQGIAENCGVAVKLYRPGEDDIVFGNAALSVLPYAVLSRSTQPLLAYSISAHGENVVYLGGAALEAQNDTSFAIQRDQMISDSEILILGIHGPLYKEALPSLSEKASNLHTIIAANAEVLGFLDAIAVDVPIYDAESDGAIRNILQ